MVFLIYWCRAPLTNINTEILIKYMCFLKRDFIEHVSCAKTGKVVIMHMHC